MNNIKNIKNKITKIKNKLKTSRQYSLPRWYFISVSLILTVIYYLYLNKLSKKNGYNTFQWKYLFIYKENCYDAPAITYISACSYRYNAVFTLSLIFIWIGAIGELISPGFLELDK